MRVGIVGLGLIGGSLARRLVDGKHAGSYEVSQRSPVGSASRDLRDLQDSHVSQDQHPSQDAVSSQGAHGLHSLQDSHSLQAGALTDPHNDASGALSSPSPFLPNQPHTSHREVLEVLAWNHTERPYAQAQRDGIICMPTLEALVEARPDILVLCNPLKAMPEMLSRIAPCFDVQTTTLTDVGSVKAVVREQVAAVGLERSYVGAHPMAGNERSGFECADSTLFDGALWAVTVDETSEYRRFLNVARLITEIVGNRIIVVDDATHDEAAALISHMPHVVATAMINELTSNPGRNIAAALAAGSWRDMTRVALTDPHRTQAMVEEDAHNVASLLRSMATRLCDVADALQTESAVHEGTQNGAESELSDFFAYGQPFRTFKTIENRTARGDGDYPQVDVHIDSSRWQSDLADSARRGEHILRFVSPHHVLAQIRSAV